LRHAQPRYARISLPLPPLNALRAFEAAARHCSYVAAAEELGISSAAISQQVRKLEDFLGKQMFVRLNNRVVLTDAGQAIFDGAHAALRLISETTEQHTTRRSSRPLVLSCIGSIAERWLVPRIVDYARAAPDFRFDLRIEPDPVAFLEHDIDLRLGYDPSHYPGMEIVALERDTVLPMCSPAYLARHAELLEQGMAAASPEDLLHTNWGPLFGSLPAWPSWFAAAGLAPPALPRGFHIGNSGATLDMAKHGLGIALGQAMMAQADLAEGKLVALSPVSVPLGYPYCLAYAPAKQHKRHLAGLIAHFSG